MRFTIKFFSTVLALLASLPPLYAQTESPPPGTLTVLHSFSPEGGSYPTVIGSGGILYGITESGGEHGGGTIFAFDPTTLQFRWTHHLSPSGSDAYPSHGLVEGHDGALYGTTWGAEENQAAIFRISLEGEYSVTAALSDTPLSRLVKGSEGIFYYAGSRGIYRVAASSVTELKSHNSADGGYINNLLMGSDGFIYGTSHSDATQVDTIFRLSSEGQDYQVLKVFDPLEDGIGISSPLMEGRDRYLYGTTQGNGVIPATVYRVSKAGVLSVIRRFQAWEGFGLSGLTEGPDGALYGSAAAGTWNEGSIFALTTDGSVLSQVCSLSGDAGQPRDLRGPLVFQGGMILGASWYGGDHNAGTLFRLDDVISPASFAAISAIEPPVIEADPEGLTLKIYGKNFDAKSVVRWDRTNQFTTYISANELNVYISPDDLYSVLWAGDEFMAGRVTVINQTGGESGPAVCTVYNPAIAGTLALVESKAVEAGQTVLVQTLSLDESPTAGVSALLEKAEGSEPSIVTAATYTGNPTPSAGFEAGGGFVDLNVKQAVPEDRLAASFYYPARVIGDAEYGLKLHFFDGTQWWEVRSSGGLVPEKNTTDNLDGTISGGRFKVTFDSSSSPAITELTGTVFASGLRDTTPPSLSCPDVVLRSTGAPEVQVNYPAPVAGDNSGVTPRLSYSIASGSLFRIGTTTVNCTASDDSGNQTVDTFAVTVLPPFQFTGFLSPIGGGGHGGRGLPPPRPHVQSREHHSREVHPYGKWHASQ